MIIIQIVNDQDIARPRALSAQLQLAARAMPVVVVTGARQTGKSTLVRELISDDRLYLTLDDLDVLDQAKSRPEDLVARAQRMTLDEVQRAPELLLAVKRAVDRGKRPRGRYFLTGSANVLLMRTISESLAGRASYLTLWPMTRREQLGLGRAGIWDELLEARDDQWREVVASQNVPKEDWTQLARRGGYPTPALELDSAERSVWFAGYTKTYLERDIQEISSVTALPDLRRLMRAAVLRLGQLVNQTELGRDVVLPQPTVHRYMNLFETSYQLVRVPAYAANRGKRLIKTPKLYWCDTGLALHLGGIDKPSGAHLENLVLTDLLAWRESRKDQAEVMYWRTTTGEEVDFVVETNNRLLPIEVKATTRPVPSDAKHLRTFREQYGKSARTALLLHTGDETEWLAPGILAAPWWRVL